MEWTGLSSRADVTEHDNHMVDAVMYKIKAALPEKASKQLEIKSNHPLMLMVSVDTSVCVCGEGGGGSKACGGRQRLWAEYYGS